MSGYYDIFYAFYDGIETRGIQIRTLAPIDENALNFDNWIVYGKMMKIHRGNDDIISYVTYTFFKNPQKSDENFLSHLREYLEKFNLVILPFYTESIQDGV